MPLQSYLGSYKLPTGLKTHAFAGGGTPLSRWLWAGGESAVRGREVPDRVRLSLILDLLDGLNFLHGRGSAHLSLSADVLYVQNGSDAGGIAVGAACAAPRPRLQFVGLGAAIRLQVPSGRKTFQMSEAGTPFYAPELLDGALIETNLRALLRMDAWAAGVLIAMIAGSQRGLAVRGGGRLGPASLLDAGGGEGADQRAGRLAGPLPARARCGRRRLPLPPRLARTSAPRAAHA